MQSKKRAKPVKFGKPEKAAKDMPDVIKKAAVKSEKESAPQVEDTATEKDTKVKEASADVADKDEDKPHSVEAHFSRVETLDITEVPGSTTEIKEASVKVPDEDVASAEKSEDAESPEESAKESPEGSESSDDNSAQQEDDLEVAPVEESEEELEAEESETKESLLDKDGAFFNTPPDSEDRKKSKLASFFLIAFVAFLLGLTFFAGIYYAVSRDNGINLFSNSQEAEPTEVPVTEEPTEEPIDLARYDIRVLNGTSTSGIAAQVRDELTSAGFTVVSIGNAAEDDFVRTEIEAIGNVDKKYLEKLKEALGESYDVGTVSEIASGAADVVVTVGSASAE